MDKVAMAAKKPPRSNVVAAELTHRLDNIGPVAQLGERVVRNDEAAGSNPARSTWCVQAQCSERGCRDGLKAAPQQSLWGGPAENRKTLELRSRRKPTSTLQKHGGFCRA